MRRSPADARATSAGVWLFFSRRLEKVFWSEKWIDVSARCLDADRLRRERRVRSIELTGLVGGP